VKDCYVKGYLALNAKGWNAKVRYVSAWKVLMDSSVMESCALVMDAYYAKDSYKWVFEPDETDSCMKDCFERVLELCQDLLLMQV
jgi:hypothetical protein